MGALYTGLALGSFCLLLGLPGLFKTASRRYVLGGALTVGATMLAGLAPLPAALPGLPRIAVQGYWPNLLLTLLVSLGALALLLGPRGWRREEFGLRLGFNPGTGRDVRRWLLPLLVVEVGILWALVPSGKPTLSYHLLQLSVGVTEELAFRGVLLALLDRVFVSRVRVLGAELGYGAVASTLVFGLCHGLRVDADFHVALNFMPMAIPTVGGFVLAWCRARSGSLLLPIFVHSGMNEVAQLVALAKAWL
ncbi:MAG: CPBP family intramembrane metalloprotease [Bacteroidota bacterium]|nr:CPBP family intramembrane metalloprotease [Bacteroidota bacterium]